MFSKDLYGILVVVVAYVGSSLNSGPLLGSKI